MSADISTYALAELTSASINHKIPPDEILTVWYAIGNFIMNALQGKKGVKMSGFGVFSLSQTSIPVFSASSEFISQYKLRQSSSVASANIPTMLLNFAFIAQKCQFDRDKAEKIYNKFITTLGRAIGEGRVISLTIKNVAQIMIGKGDLNVDFQTDFLDNFKSTTNLTSTSGLAPPPSSSGRFKNAASKTISQLRATSRPRSGGFGNSNTQMGSISNNTRSITPTLNNQRNSSTASLTSANLNRLTQQQQQQSMASSNYNVNPREIAARAINNSSTESIIDKVRAKIVERGGSGGIRTITRLLAIMDDNGDKKLSRDELKYGLKDYGIELNPNELEQVFAYFDRDRDGTIDVDEFLVGLRGDLNNRRKSMVRMAFDIIDTDRSGVISIDEVMAKYDFTHHPDVREGKKTIQQAAKEFMAHWERGKEDDQITYDEFEDYYKDISASIDDDDYFELMMRNAWRIAGGTGMAANTANRRLLVTKADGSQYVETIQNELGLGSKDMDGMRSRLKQQGVDATNIDLYGYQDNTTKARQVMDPSRFNQNLPQQRNQVQGRNSQVPYPRPPPQPQPRQSSSGSIRGYPVPNGGGDQSFPPPPPSTNGTYRNTSGNGMRPTGNNNTNSNITSIHVDDVMAILAKLLYTPPVTLEQLCNKLQVSLASHNPRMAMGAFKSRISTLDQTLDKNTVNDVWKAIDPKNIGSIEIAALHELLAGRFGKDKSTMKQTTNVIERAKAKILERCGGQAGIKGLTRALAVMDINGDKRLTKEELKYGLQDYGIELNIRELEEVFGYFDRNRLGYIDITEFLVGMRGDLNDRRKQFVQMAFNILDKDKSGTISVDEVAAVYDVSHHPDVISGKKTKQEAFLDFMDQWERGKHDGVITYDEFEDYYKELSSSIDGDDYFELMMRNAWRIPGGKGMAANTANRRLLVTKADGSQYVETIQNELGLGSKDMDGMRSRLKQQGVDATNIDLYGYQDNTSKPKSGMNPPTSLNRSGLRQNMQQQQQPQRTAFDRHMAAMKLAAVYRGKVARKQVEHEKRKMEALRKQQEEEKLEANRPKPKQILRPKGKSYIGF